MREILGAVSGSREEEKRVWDGREGHSLVIEYISLCFPLNFTTHTHIIYLKSHANVKKVSLECVNFNIIGRQASGMGQNRLPLSLGSGVEGC